MNIKEIISEGVSGKVIDFSMAELVVLRGAMMNIEETVIKPYRDKAEGEVSSRVSPEYAAKRVLGNPEVALPLMHVLKDITAFLANITENVTSLEEASKSLFAVKEEVKEEVAEYNEL